MSGEGFGLFFVLGMEDEEGDFRRRENADGRAPRARAAGDVEF